ncbi:MAG: hypothetical protein IT436_00490 [Phycisphaerales bacterium]|nr:hypothetical protein [Phycisphaerales bacterium]
MRIASIPGLAAVAVLMAPARPADAQCESRWWSAGPGAGPGGEVRAMLTADVEGGPRLYIGGEFQTLGGVQARRIGSWDGAGWRQVGPGLSQIVESMVIHPYAGGERLFIGGFFDEGEVSGGPGGLVWLDPQAGGWRGVPRGSPFFWTMGLCSFGGELFASAGVMDYVWRLGESGWSVPGEGLESVVHRGLTHDDGTGPSLFVGGSMLEGCRRWDGVAWRSIGGGVQGAVYGLAVFDDGRGPALYVGGQFIRAGVFGAGGVQAANIARWDGTRWESLGAGIGGTVNALAVFDDGAGPKLYAGGRFTSAGAAPAKNLAVWDGHAWMPVAGGVDGEVRALAVFDADGPGPARARLVAGGAITAAGGEPAAGLAFYGPCGADLTCDGIADFADYLEFLNRYDSGDARADLNGDGLVDFADYLEFLNLYAAGC